MLEAFKIGIALSLVNGVSGVLGTIARDFVKTDIQAQKLQRSLKEIKLLGAGGMVLGGAAYVGFRALEGLVKPASAYADQLVRLQTLNLGQIDMATATAAAWQTTRDVMTSTATENVKAVGDLVQVFGDVNTAIKYLPQVAKVNSALQFVRGYGNKSADESFDAAKALELRGASTDPAMFSKQLDLISKAVIATQGRVAPSDLLTYFKRAGLAGTSFDDRFTYGILPGLIQELGGNTTGTALMSAYQAIVGGRMTKASYGIMTQLGLADPKGKAREGAAGTIQLDPKAIKGADIFRLDPLEFVKQILRPAEQAHGITDPKAQEAILTQLFGNRNALKIVNILEQQEARLAKTERRTGEAFNSDKAYDTMMKESPGAQMAAFNAQMENLKISLGQHLIPLLVTNMPKITKGIDSIIGFIDRHPTFTKDMLLGAAALDVLGGAISGFILAIAGLKTVGWFVQLFTKAAPIAEKAAPAVIEGALAAGKPVGGAAPLLEAVPLLSKVLPVAEVLGPIGAVTAINMQQDKFHKDANGKLIMPERDAEHAWWQAHVTYPLERLLGIDGRDVKQAAQDTKAFAEQLAGEIAKAVKEALHGGAVNLDGRKAGSIMFEYMNRQPPTGGSNYDTRLSPLFPATGFK